MKRLLLLTSLIALVPLAAARSLSDIQASGTIRIGTEAAYAPFTYYQGKKLTGFEIELAEAIAKQMGLKVEWIDKPFDSLLIGLGQDRFDFVIASHGITAERQKAATFASPHYCSGGLIVVKKGGPKTAAALKGKTVAVQVGTTYYDQLKKLGGLKDVKTYPQNTDALQNLRAGRVDALVSDRFAGLEALKKDQTLEAGELLFQERIGMAVAKNNPGLAKALSAALKKVQANGTYTKISKKYFGEDIRCE
ncbi:polar amino acid transport system substrate-binding protein [Deinobacterium chartae]|uniref:Polar amino acid transport system substrate-binding protein n=1 Tax=Deinobacterium chartae TaxID=521158 RepID=A0A841I0T1_9DEIO|nr:ABC transporter substrate-binding protein [Deinobacterium chartae]MBB6098040.1 polar amino acid transport system substrate-binding protein [Deinobacterium chartae]